MFLKINIRKLTDAIATRKKDNFFKKFLANNFRKNALISELSNQLQDSVKSAHIGITRKTFQY